MQIKLYLEDAGEKKKFFKFYDKEIVEYEPDVADFKGIFQK